MVQFMFHCVNLLTAKIISQEQEETMEGGVDQPISTMFYIKQRTNGVKEALPMRFLQTTWHRTYLVKEGRNPRIEVLGEVKPTASI